MIFQGCEVSLPLAILWRFLWVFNFFIFAGCDISDGLPASLHSLQTVSCCWYASLCSNENLGVFFVLTPWGDLKHQSYFLHIWAHFCKCRDMGCLARISDITLADCAWYPAIPDSFHLGFFTLNSVYVAV